MDIRKKIRGIKEEDVNFLFDNSGAFTVRYFNFEYDDKGKYCDIVIRCSEEMAPALKSARNFKKYFELNSDKDGFFIENIENSIKEKEKELDKLKTYLKKAKEIKELKWKQ